MISTFPQGGTQAGNAFDSSFSDGSKTGNMYDKMTDKAYSQATRTLDPTFDRMRQDFDQRAVNQGLATGTEAYNTAFDQYSRDKNDAYSTAAFNAMGYGANRMDTDRNFREDRRQFNRGDETSRYNADQNRAAAAANAAAQRASSRYQVDEGARQFNANYGEGNRRYDQEFGLNEMTTMEGLRRGFGDDQYRDAVFNSQQDQQQFNNLFQMMGMAPGNTPTGGNPSTAFDNALTGQIYNDKAKSAMYTGIGNTAKDFSQIDWSQFNWGNDTVQPTVQPSTSYWSDPSMDG